MGYRLRDVESACKFSSTLTVEAISQAVPHAALTMAELALCVIRSEKLDRRGEQSP